MNLVSNALKYSAKSENPRVEIASEAQDGEVVISIRDNGAGFDMRYADKLFGVFQRLHSQDEFEGSGVGLAIVHRIVARHGGHVWAEGQVGRGATFHFSLPNH
jgi:two-component system sensor histidine kinase/response regulator